MTRLHVSLLLMIAASLLMPARAGTANDALMRSAAGQVLKSSRPLEKVASYPEMAVYRQSGGGFAIVSSNEEKPKVLAYSHTGDLDLSSDNPACDVDDDGKVNISDVTALINILLTGNH